jgi:serine/threonine-protein kinase
MAVHTLAIMVGGRIPVEVGDIAEVELLELLGMGGFGSAWKVVDNATKKLYVLKIIQGLIPGSIMVERVRLEAGVSIPSEYVVQVVGLREWDPSTYLIVFEYFQGISLDKLLEEGTLTKNQKKNIFNKVLMGVSHAHHNNVVHRDLKPANILVGEDEQVKLIDFGISKFKGGGLTKSGEIIGTLPYIAPELILRGGKVADARADIYSLGQILYELTMDQHFWSRQGWSELNDLVGYLTQTPPPTEIIDLSDFACDFFSKAPNILLRMAKIDPDERYYQIDEVLSELGYIPDLPSSPKDLHLRYPLLIVESGSNRGARTLINIKSEGVMIFGRSDIAGADDSISRRHLEFSRSKDSYFIRDLGSKNGTMVGGIVLSSSDYTRELRHGDRIKVGDVFLRFAFLHMT